VGSATSRKAKCRKNIKMGVVVDLSNPFSNAVQRYDCSIDFAGVGSEIMKNYRRKVVLFLKSPIHYLSIFGFTCENCSLNTGRCGISTSDKRDINKL